MCQQIFLSRSICSYYSYSLHACVVLQERQRALPTSVPTPEPPRSEHAEDLLPPVIDSSLEKLTTCEGVREVVVEESGPIQYDEEGLDDVEMEELVYEDDPLLHSDYEDEGG